MDTYRLMASAIDPLFTAELVHAAQAGVQLIGRRCLVSTAEIALREQVPILLAPGA